ncbi:MULTISPECIES: DUF805 domain-containing protein [unclassified Caulobacter]|uniref:DUF805 domain-containing protein n=1 Tax=unclassified Caulobacter TaxID=2648921 RepID=UPI0009E7A4CB|nr:MULTISPECIES: DUF805 domain-containing protein [unclassified Caulobacter]
MDWKTLFLSPEGRIGRQAFWIGWLCLLGASVVLSAIPLIGHVLMLVVIYASVCIHTKRLHDMGQTGWWQVLPVVFGPVLVMGSALSIGVLPAIAALTHGEPELSVLAALGGFAVSCFIAFAIWLAFTLWVGCSSGQIGDNKYGSPPTDTAAVAL